MKPGNTFLSTLDGKVENELKFIIYAYILCQNDESITYHVCTRSYFILDFFRDYVDPISLWVSICDIVTPTWPKI